MSNRTILPIQGWLRLATLLPFVTTSFADGFVPSQCRIESWCLISATECFVGYVDHPNGLFQGVAQYSVVRRAVAHCPDGAHGQWVRRTFMSPVQATVYKSEIVTTDERARTESLQLCTTYRRDWIFAAPTCRSPET